MTGPGRTVFMAMVPRCFEGRTCLLEAQHSAAAVSTDFFFFFFAAHQTQSCINFLFIFI